MDQGNVIYIYTMEIESTIKSEIMSFVENWMQLESVMLSEISQTPKSKHHDSSHLCILDFV